MIYINLSGSWTLKRIATGEQYPCTIPGDNISALFNAGIISDPYFGENELELQWIGREAWSFIKNFEADRTLAELPNILIELESIDTISEIKLNNTVIGISNNEFRRYSLPVSGILKEGMNTLEITIQSAEAAAIEARKALAYPVPHAQFPVQSPGRNLIRKTQCHSGWDWGPCLMVSGIYGKANVKASPLEMIKHLHCDVNSVTDDLSLWEINIAADIQSSKAGSCEIAVSCADVEQNKIVELSRGMQTFSLQLKIKNPELWWPAGYGRQAIYDLKLTTDNDEAVAKIGFRKLEVITDNDDRGIGMLFRINSHDIFAKGANWIPSDALPSRQSRERYEDLINSAVDANMNMLRVWGGGKYESDDFYELCDEKGILIWQDFMFACSMYPSDEDFLKNVESELEYQIKRLKNHPSIALWCGNNENVGALGWFEETKQNRDRYIIDYDRLNEGVVGKAVKKLDPGRRWWSSSPSAGEGDYSDCWHDDSKGDMHYWSVWHEGKPFEAYKEVIPRFCSEFGFQSFPSIETIKTFTPEDQLSITSPVMDHHQRNEKGNTIIISTISSYFRFPESFEELIYLSRIQQAMAIKTAVEYWRSNKPVCMGTLYWQLNDTWPAASWASLDYDGSWKPLHYSAKRFYAPLLVTMNLTADETMEVKIVNDGFDAVNGQLFIELRDFSGGIIKTIKKSVTAEAESAGLFETVKLLNDRYFKRNHFYRAVFLPDQRDQTATENFMMLTRPKQCSIEPAVIKTKLLRAEGIPAVSMTTDKPAFHVMVDVPGFTGRFSDNNFTLIPGSTKVITLEGVFNEAELEKAEVIVHSLRNI